MEHTVTTWNYRPIPSMSSYEYRPLADAELRCLRIVHGDDTKNVTIELKHFKLENMVDKYLALSYVWGEAAPVHEISIASEESGQGLTLLVRQNCYEFLRHWRGTSQGVPEVSTWLWIDAICINQDNIQERNRHVMQMINIIRMP